MYWVKTKNEDYVNLELATDIIVASVGDTYEVQAYFPFTDRTGLISITCIASYDDLEKARSYVEQLVNTAMRGF